MSNPYVGEIRLFGGNFAPNGWMFCEGQLLPISENDVLFNLIGTTYGGDGQSTFALPDLRGRVPVHQGTGFVVGQAGGTETETLSANQMPVHSHALLASTDGGTSSNPGGHVLASSPTVTAYIAQDPDGTLPASSITAAGGSQPHENMMPTLAVSYIISLFGVYPTQT